MVIAYLCVIQMVIFFNPLSQRVANKKIQATAHSFEIFEKVTVMHTLIFFDSSSQ